MRALASLLAALAVACGGGTTQTAPTTPAPAPVAEPAPPVEPAPTPAPALVWPEEPFRAERPAAGPARPMQLPALTTFELPNGIQVFLVERHELPTVSLDLVFDGGSIDDPRDKAGLASLCMTTLADGTEKLDKVAFEEALADMASTVYAMASVDQKIVGAATLTKHLDATLDLWADVLLRPGLRQTDFDRNVKQAIVGIEQARKSPGGAAARVADGILYGPDHVYARVRTEKTIGKITLADCKKLVKTYLKPKGAKLFVVGDLTRRQVEEEIGGRLAAWKGRPKAAVKVGKAKPRRGRIFFVDTPGATQAQVRIMHLGPARKDKDYFSVRLLSAILGGSFSSRINMNIRESKGWAYGARGGFGHTRDVGYFVASASVRADATKGSIIEMMKEIRGLIDADATADELEREKNGLVLSLPGEFASGRSALGQYRSLVYFGLPLNYFDSFVDNVAAVDLAAVRAAAVKHLKPDEAKLLVVGDAKVVRPMLDELVAEGLFGKDPIVTLDADGNVLP